MSETRQGLTNAVADRERKALAIDLALASLDFVDAPTVHSLSNLQRIRDNLGSLETMLVYQLRQDDVTWEEIASTLRVTRQSAHRRLSRKIAGFANEAYRKSIQHESGRALMLRFNSNVDAIRELVGQLSYLKLPSWPRANPSHSGSS